MIFGFKLILATCLLAFLSLASVNAAGFKFETCKPLDKSIASPEPHGLVVNMSKRTNNDGTFTYQDENQNFFINFFGAMTDFEVLAPGAPGNHKFLFTINVKGLPYPIRMPVDATNNVNRICTSDLVFDPKTLQSVTMYRFD